MRRFLRPKKDNSPNSAMTWPVEPNDRGVVHYHIERNLLSKKECEEVIEIARPLLAAGNSDYVQPPPLFDTCRLPTPGEDPSITWLYSRVEYLIQQYNRKMDFYIHGIDHPLGVSRYKTGHHMDAHNDYNSGHSAKISTGTVLNDDYEGGEFVLDNETFQPCKRRQGRGDGIAFASYETHKVEEVTAGERWVLLGWCGGPRFR